MEGLFYSPNVSLDNGGPLVLTDYEIGPSGPGNFSIGSYTGSNNQNYSSVRQSDIAAFNTGYAIWINGTQPVAITAELGPPPGTPNNSFPFARLASVTVQTTTFLYHQIDGTTFAEEQWDSTEGAWLRSENITVSNP
ncbi:hypothetical protein IMSHALPRED_008956 [Imshaugia aleurites]|uniref:Uncharacterized protein n=1 Tax=Imshaugia aleurites TaxID=172621 RepID=A0A8H3FUX5_9LECA|nr:hypothetical protein IMSHALPRED_008956 [Imshaugia aleurites]